MLGYKIYLGYRKDKISFNEDLFLRNLYSRQGAPPMSIIQHIIDSIKDDAPVREVRICIHATLVESLRVGVCGHSRADQAYEVIHRQDVVANHGKLTNFSAQDLSRYALSKLPIEASVGIAAINSILDADWAKLKPQKYSEILIEKAKDKSVAVVGHFPFIGRMRKTASNLVELGLEPGTGDKPVSDAPEVLPRADIVLISSSTLVNHTIDHMLHLSRNASFVAVAGPSVIFSPIFFRYGAHAVMGPLIEDVAVVIKHLSEGSSLTHLEGLSEISMYSEDYLGI